LADERDKGAVQHTDSGSNRRDKGAVEDTVLAAGFVDNTTPILMHIMAEA
jgi:hypothetical protein